MYSKSIKKSIIEKYKSHICEITKDPEFSNKIFAYGFTSAVYRLGDSVIKETYLSKGKLENENLNKEIDANILLMETPELQPYTIKFEGFEFCGNKMYTKYEYVGDPLFDTILDYSPTELKFILNKTLKNIKIIHKFIIHRDLHLRNIFLVKNKDGKIKNVIFGDWGAAVIKEGPLKEIPEDMKDILSNKTDIELFLKSFKERLEKAYFFKNVNIKNALKLLEDKGKKKYFFNILNSKMARRKIKYPHRPPEFIEKSRPYFFNEFLFGLIKKEYSDNFIIKKCKFSNEMKEFIQILDKKISILEKKETV
jgi:hypothetical protein